MKRVVILAILAASATIAHAGEIVRRQVVREPSWLERNSQWFLLAIVLAAVIAVILWFYWRKK
ncbi:MAG: hypothetical protein KBD00_05290 [Candidatus Peribacteraceae bacterium]|nr:hypothetical protein [Candidatus Peribacteraceae bacterium]